KRAVLALRSFIRLGPVIGPHLPRRAGCVTRPAKHKKPARELRQGGSYYRCCIPALAGLVSPQSIAPDGERISPAPNACATRKQTGRCRASALVSTNESAH